VDWIYLAHFRDVWCGSADIMTFGFANKMTCSSIESWNFLNCRVTLGFLRALYSGVM
jgi:hypothetical protein